MPVDGHGCDLRLVAHVAPMLLTGGVRPYRFR